MPKRILIVDDDRGICNSLAMLLRGEGYDVDATTDSGRGAFLINKERYDVCLFDYKMSGLDGKELVNIAKNVNPRCPVFIISGMLDIEELCKREVKEGLVNGVFSKPFDIDALLQRIAAV